MPSLTGTLGWRFWVVQEGNSSSLIVPDNMKSKPHQVPALTTGAAADCREQELPGVLHSHGVIKHNVLFGKL